MKNLMKYLSPFAPDISGAVEVLFGLGGLVVIIDAGGCTGNVCGFDEPRWFQRKSAVFSAGLRDLDAILGRDRLMLDKTEQVLRDMDAKFVAFVGTPVPSVIGTDFRGLAGEAARRFGLPVFSIDTNGMDLCDRGAEKAYLALVRYALSAAGKGGAQKISAPNSGNRGTQKAGASNPDDRGTQKKSRPALLVLGCTPMDLAPGDTEEAVRERLLSSGRWDDVLILGQHFEDLAKIPEVTESLVIAPSGLAAAKELNRKCGIPCQVGYPLPEAMLRNLQDASAAGRTARSAVSGAASAAADGTARTAAGGAASAAAGRTARSAVSGAASAAAGGNSGRTLIIHQAVLASEIRRRLEAPGSNLSGEKPSGDISDGGIQIGTFFAAPKELMREGDVHLKDEDAFIRLVSEGHYGCIAADPLLARAVPQAMRENVRFLPLEHFAVSGNTSTEPSALQ